MVLLFEKEDDHMPIYKRCSRCGRRIPTGTTCSCIKRRHKEYDKTYRNKEAKKYYDSGEWQQARAAALEADDSIDVYVYMTEDKIVAADTVHHIIPLKDDWNRRSDIDNLISLNHDTHSMIERKYKQDKEKMQQELSSMLEKYREMRRGGAV